MRHLVRLSCVALFAAAVGGCGDDTTSTGGADLSVAADMSICTGGPVTGAKDMHCYDDGGANFISVDPTMCGIDAGATSGGPGDFGDTMYNTSGNDDDCKYAVSYSIPGGICRGGDTFFVVTLEDAIMNKPVTGADHVRPEIFETASMTPVNTSTSMTTESPPGTYKIGPIKFTSAGNYTVRFHFYENCTDTPSSPHGHAAFFVNVP